MDLKIRSIIPSPQISSDTIPPFDIPITPLNIIEGTVNNSVNNIETKYQYVPEANAGWVVNALSSNVYYNASFLNLYSRGDVTQPNKNTLKYIGPAGNFQVNIVPHNYNIKYILDINYKKVSYGSLPSSIPISLKTNDNITLGLSSSAIGQLSGVINFSLFY